MLKWLFPQKREKTYRMIRESIDTLPTGICFATPEGIPILTNRTMNGLTAQILGHTIMDAELTWKELTSGISSVEGIRLSDDPWLKDITGTNTETDRPLIYILPSGEVWMFEKTIITDELGIAVQLLATDISELYSKSRKLYEDNLRLEAQNRRQKEILEDIVRINRDKELLAIKANVHDDIGHCLLATAIEINRNQFPENLPPLVTVWKTAMHNLTERSIVGSSDDGMRELLQSAELIGCRIECCGSIPAERISSLLLQAAIREALTNAVRHAGADCLYVKINPDNHDRLSDYVGWDAEIWDNGYTEIRSIREGNGLSSLRSRVEQEGGTLSYDLEDGVRLKLHLPGRGGR